MKRFAMALVLMCVLPSLLNAQDLKKRTKYTPFWRDKAVLTLATIQTSAQIADGVTTMQDERLGYLEADPISRTFLGQHPTWNRMVPIGAVQIIGTSYLAHYMHKSNNKWVRRFWWIPQSVSISASTYCAIDNVRIR